MGYRIILAALCPDYYTAYTVYTAAVFDQQTWFVSWGRVVKRHHVELQWQQHGTSCWWCSKVHMTSDWPNVNVNKYQNILLKQIIVLLAWRWGWTLYIYFEKCFFLKTTRAWKHWKDIKNRDCILILWRDKWGMRKYSFWLGDFIIFFFFIKVEEEKNILGCQTRIQIVWDIFFCLDLDILQGGRVAES